MVCYSRVVGSFLLGSLWFEGILSIDCDSSNYYYSEDGKNIMVNCEFNWYEANEFCLENFETTLASITDSNENDGVEQLCEKNTAIDALCWIGGYNIESDGVTPFTFSWVDGTQDTSYTDWVYPGDQVSNQCIGVYMYHSYAWGWTPFDCAAHTGAAICSAERTSTVCDETNIEYTSDGKNIFVDCDFNWFEANEFCLDKFGTTLTSITTEEENEIIKSKCMETTTRDALCWIGMYNIEQPETSLDTNDIDFDWIDGTMYYPGASFQDFAFTQPGTDSEGYCGGMYYWHSDPYGWAWVPIDCLIGSGAAFCDANRPTMSPTEQPTEER